MPPHQTRGRWSKSSHLVESRPSQTNSWSSSSAVCSWGSDLPAEPKTHKKPPTRKAPPITCHCFTGANNITQTLQVTTGYRGRELYHRDSQINHNVEPPFHASVAVWQFYTHISVKLQPALMHSNQVTTPVWDHHALHMPHAQIFSLLLRPLPPLLYALQSHLLCAAPLMAPAGGNPPGCWVCTTVYTCCCWIDQSTGLSWLAGSGSDGRGRHNKHPAKSWRRGGHCWKHGSKGKQLDAVENCNTDWRSCWWRQSFLNGPHFILIWLRSSVIKLNVLKIKK